MPSAARPRGALKRPSGAELYQSFQLSIQDSDARARRMRDENDRISARLAKLQAQAAERNGPATNDTLASGAATLASGARNNLQSVPADDSDGSSPPSLPAEGGAALSAGQGQCGARKLQLIFTRTARAVCGFFSLHARFSMSPLSLPYIQACTLATMQFVLHLPSRFDRRWLGVRAPGRSNLPRLCGEPSSWSSARNRATIAIAPCARMLALKASVG